jgi:hypothetical protein
MELNLFDYIKGQEEAYSMPIDLTDEWSWSMRDHINRSFLYINSQFSESNDVRDQRPFKNIILPILNIQFRTEGFDVKDINLFVDNPDNYYKSLLVNKYHNKWALKNEIDTFIDEMVENYGTYGGVLVRKTKRARPEVIDLRTLAFANQTDILNHPFGILHEMSFGELRQEAKARGWGEEGADIDIESLITLVQKEEKNTVQLYEIHGTLPVEYLEGEDIIDESEEYVNQVQIVAFYQDENSQRQGVTLFKKEEPELPFKFLARDRVKNRALGRGGVEELFEAQQWTNQNEVWKAEMLESASKTLFASDDPTLKSRNNLNDMSNNEVIHLKDGKSIQQIDTYPRNLQVFNDALDRWEQQTRIIGSASEGQLGESPSAGTPFKLFEAQQIEAQGMHKYRQGQLATFMDEIYRDWIIPHLAREIIKENNFMDELSTDEMQEVVKSVVEKKVNRFKIEIILSGQEIDEELLTLYEEQVKNEEFTKGNKRFFKMLANEMKGDNLDVMTNIVGKQRNLALMTDKLVNVLRQFISTPQIRQDPEMNKLVNIILESSGLSPITFGPAPQQALPVQGTGGTEPLQDLSQANQQQ